MSFLQQLFGTSAWEATAVLCALAYLLLAVRRSLWSWPCAFASASIYLVLFARQQLYMQTLLQAFYIGMAVYGFVEWRRGRTPGGQVAITRRPATWHARSLGTVVLLALLLGWALASFSDARAPYVDSFVTCGSIVTTWMVARRILENWLYWVLFDSVSAALYFSQGFFATGLLFIAYVGIVIHGYTVWRRELHAQQAAGAAAG